MEKTNDKMTFQAEELEQRLEMAKLGWFVRTNDDPYNRVEVGASVSF